MANVTGPASSTDTAIATWNGTSGTVIQDNVVLVDASGNITGLNSISSDAGTFTSDGSGNVTAASFNGVFNGTSTTQSPGDNSTNIATTAYVDTGLSDLSLDSLTDVATDYSTLFNMSFGDGAGVSISTGYYNLFLGQNAGTSISFGRYNVAFGYSALGSLVGDIRNVAIGYNAMTNATTANGNVAVGVEVLEVLITGGENVAIGAGAGATLTTGDGNILIGNGADVPNATTSNYLTIGNGAHTAISGPMDTGPALMNGFTARTQSPGDNSTKVATTAYVDTGLAGKSSSTLTSAHLFVGNGSNVATDTAITGDVTISNIGATTITNNVVSNAKFRQSAGLSVVGNTGSSTANVADITGTANQVLVVNSGGTALSFGKVNLTSAAGVTGTLPLANIAAIANNTILGNNSGSTASPIALTAAQTKTLLAIANTDVSGLGTMSTQNASSVAITGGSITGMSTPTNGSDVATKSYVDASTAGLSARTSSRVATTAALTATYSNGTAGVGATLTNSGTKSAISIDGVSLAANDRVLVRNQSTAAQNGIYSVTTVGSGSVNWVLTRATDFNTADSNGIVEGAYTVIEEGTANAGTLWIETGSGPFTVGTTAITFTELSVAPQTLTFTGDVTGTGSGSIALSIGASKVTNTMLAGSIAASKLVGTDIATVGTITSGTWNGTAITGTYIASSVALAGSPTTTTQTAGDNSTKIATTAYVDRVGSAAVAYNAIAGCLPSSIAGTHTTATMTVSSGQATDSTNAVYIAGAGYSWAVSNGNAINGYQGGTTLPNSSTIHMFLCTGASGTGVFASTSLTPTLPTGYAVSYRRIFSFNTNGAGAPIAYTAIEVEGGAMIAWLTTQVLDYSTTLTSANRTLITLSVPSGVKMQPFFRARSAASTNGIIFTAPDETDVAISNYAWTWTTAPGNDISYGSGTYTTCSGGGQLLITDTSARIGARAYSGTVSETLYFVTRGWKDFRRG